MERRDSQKKIPGILTAISLALTVACDIQIWLGQSLMENLIDFITVILPLVLLLFFFFGRGKVQAACFPIAMGIYLILGVSQIALSLYFRNSNLWYFDPESGLYLYRWLPLIVNAFVVAFYACLIYDWFRQKLLLCRIMVSIRLAILCATILLALWMVIEIAPHITDWREAVWLLIAQIPLPVALFLYYFLCFKAEPKASCDAKTGRNP